MTEAEFKRRIWAKSFTPEDLEKGLSVGIFALEKELHVYITDTYPLTKFYNQIDELTAFRKKEEKENKKMMRQAKRGR